MGERQKNVTVLLINHCEDVRYILSAYLRAQGYTVVEVDTGPQAVRSATTGTPPDLIITNFPVPTEAGSATESLKAHPRLRHVPVLNVTTKVFPEQLASAAQAGVDGNVPLPAPLSELLSHIEESLSASPEA